MQLTCFHMFLEACSLEKLEPVWYPAPQHEERESPLLTLASSMLTRPGGGGEPADVKTSQYVKMPSKQRFPLCVIGAAILSVPSWRLFCQYCTWGSETPPPHYGMVPTGSESMVSQLDAAFRMNDFETPQTLDMSSTKWQTIKLKFGLPRNSTRLLNNWQPAFLKCLFTVNKYSRLFVLCIAPYFLKSWGSQSQINSESAQPLLCPDSVILKGKRMRC